jgi:GTP cyclohydrolase I
MNSRDPSVALPGAAVSPMPDVQGSVDHRRQPIQRVGVRGLRYPLLWRGDGEPMPTVASWNLFVALPAEQKGTHMSRFVALLEGDGRSLSLDALAPLHARMLELLQADHGRLEVRFALFVPKTAPVSGVSSLMDYDVELSVDGGRGSPSVGARVVVPVTSLCPCSKSISEYGAHNQRSHLTVEVRLEPGATVVLRELVERMEQQASCELYGLLKRVDEKYVTERAYDNPKFVEDLVRDAAAAVRGLPGVVSFVVEGENFESIHNHSAYARIEG